MVYLRTFIINKNPNVGKYTSPMDPMGILGLFQKKTTDPPLQKKKQREICDVGSHIADMGPGRGTIYYPIPSMNGIFTYIWLSLMVNVDKYTIHGSFGYDPAPLILPA